MEKKLTTKLVPLKPMSIEQIVSLKNAGLIDHIEAQELLKIHHGITEPSQPHRRVMDTED
jgi:hypothetical protein